MLVRTNRIKVTDTPRKDGSYVLGVAISKEDRVGFKREFGDFEREYVVEVKPYFGETTRGQVNFFHRLLRMLSEKLGMTFEETKLWFVTKYGFPVEQDGDYVFLYIPAEQEPESTFKKGDFYFKAVEESDGVVKYLAYNGVKYLNSREMNLLLDFLKGECDSQGINIMSDDEYKKKKEKWAKSAI